MSERFDCDDKDTLVAFLYEEVDANVGLEIERHLRTCAACRAELDALELTRQDLQTWLPPESVPGFALVPRAAQQPERALTTQRWAALGELPAWASAAAAMLMMGVGLGVANVQVRSTADGWAVTTGWMQSARVAPSAAVTGAGVVPVQARGGDDEWRRELAAVQQRLHSEIERATALAGTARPTASSSEGAVVRRVQQMIAASEERQRQEVATRLIQAERIWNVRRQTNLTNVQRTLGSLQNRTFVVQATQQEAINQLRRVSLTPPNQ